MIMKKISDVSGLVTSTGIDTKIEEVDTKMKLISKLLEIKGKYFSISDYNKFLSDIIRVIRQNEIVKKADISNLVKDLNTKLAVLATKAELKAEKEKIVKLKRLIQFISIVKRFLVIMVLKICLFINHYLIH